MTKIQKELDQAWRLLSCVTVSGDSVDLLAAAREHLRQAYVLPDEAKEGDDHGG